MTFTGTILGRYVFRQAAGAVVLILVSLTGVTWIAVALRQIELMTSQGQGTITFLKMTTLTVPTLMAFIAPIAVQFKFAKLFIYGQEIDFIFGT